MFVDPGIFTYIEHWSPNDREDAAKIIFNISKRYKKWLGEEDAISESHIGMFKAYKRFGCDFRPRQANGYIRKQLFLASKLKQRFFDLAPHLKTYTIDCDVILETNSILHDIKNVLDEDEYLIVKNFIFDEDKIYTRTDRRKYKRALKKIEEALYV